MRTALPQALAFFLAAALCVPGVAFAQNIFSTNYQILAPAIAFLSWVVLD